MGYNGKKKASESREKPNLTFTHLCMELQLAIHLGFGEL